uniref:Fog-2-like protein n=1 Tax=Caenorhabditis elegans TaxID=6239 RepID=G5EBP9_CAEEL|nr:Fog-2-like protein [Caenorhabditis elegans]ADE20086.1 Fog-2-like protein [Caenorhabditis elegans]ADE20087.1 Fog-2-like protein [Caenorhabditis elegans]ADE20093.1 Fog-2-like protein [Caenorhabditis elegans]ADE20094.1 Fog-2-like protein [Caenorhabditis elegans]
MAKNLADELDSMKISGPPSLFEMPTEMVYKIAGKVDPFSRLTVRKVCRNLRNVIDDTDPGFKKVEVDLGGYAGSHRLCLTSSICSYISYSPNSNNPGCTVERNSQRKSIEKTQLDAILDDLAVIVKNPKLRLDNFVIVSSCGNSKEFVEWLREITQSGSLLHTKRIRVIDCPGDLLGVLSHCKPGFLEAIEFYCFNSGKIDEITNLEQWKRAKSINIDSRRCDDIPIEHFFHFSRFTIRMGKLSVPDAIKIRDDLMKSAHFEYGIIDIYDELTPEAARVFNPNFIAHNRDGIENKIEQCLLTIYRKRLEIKKID